MFDFGWSEIALIGIVALVLIGPKDLPVAIRAVTDVIKKMRRMAGELQGHVDDMLREADLKEAHDTFRDLRGGGLRDKMFRAIDGDGSLRRTMTEKPLGRDVLGLDASPAGTGLGRPVATGTPLGAAPAAAAPAIDAPVRPVIRTAPAFMPPGSAPPPPPVAPSTGPAVATGSTAAAPSFIPPSDPDDGALAPTASGRPDAA